MLHPNWRSSPRRSRPTRNPFSQLADHGRAATGKEKKGFQEPFSGIAAVGLLPPVAGAIAQEVIDLLAVLNALRVAIPPKSLTDF
jgi:hypothetical protein